MQTRMTDVVTSLYYTIYIICMRTEYPKIRTVSKIEDTTSMYFEELRKCVSVRPCQIKTTIIKKKNEVYSPVL